MLITVVGNRPQFIKMLPVSRAIAARGKKETVIHTGQHYDDALNAIFFRELNLPTPDIQLSISSTTHGAMTGELLAKLEAEFMRLKPRGVLLYGDTNSTLAAAIAAAKLHIPIAHVEAGPRMHDLRLPEEVNRVMTDHVSTLLFCPDQASVDNLARENITSGVYFTGDVMLDSFNLCKQLAPAAAQEPFIFMTLHRPSNVDSRECLAKLYTLLERLPLPVLFPMHLRTQKRLEEFGLLEQFRALPRHRLVAPMGYLDTVAALNQCASVITDSGGLQKEAFYAGKTAIVLLDETPWPDLKASAWQRVVGTLPEAKLEEIAQPLPTPASAKNYYGDGHAAEKIADLLIQHQLL